VIAAEIEYEYNIIKFICCEEEEGEGEEEGEEVKIRIY
jgi:hypothetical protein